MYIIYLIINILLTQLVVCQMTNGNIHIIMFNIPRHIIWIKLSTLQGQK